MVSSVVRVATLVLHTWLGIGLLYHYVLLLAGSTRQRRADAASRPLHRLAVVVPAHNEQAVISRTIGHLLTQTYPRTHYDIHIIADHCSDDTAGVARAAGAQVHVRLEAPGGRKGYALAWLLQRLLAAPQTYDAFVIFDADSRPEPNCLAALQRQLAAGAGIVQGRHVIANPTASLFAALADVDMRLNNRIRNQAKANLHLSARLMGDAMCFHRDILLQHPWVGAESLTEDRDYGIYLVTQGRQIAFAADALSLGQSTTTWHSATPQRMRWYGGAFALQKRYVATLAARSVRHLDADAFDKLLELTLPPFSIMAVLSPLLAALRLLGGERVLPGVGLWAASWLYPVAGLALERAPRSAYRALLIGPLYVMWRVWIGGRVRWRRAPIPWARTQH